MLLEKESARMFAKNNEESADIEAIGNDPLGGLSGIAAVADRASESSIAWEEAFVAAYGEPTVLAVRERNLRRYHRLALAAQAAGNTDGAAIRTT